MDSWREMLRAILRFICGLLYPRGASCLCCGDPRRASEEDCLCGACRRALAEKKVPPGVCPRCLSPLKKNSPCAFCRSPLMKPIERVYAPYRYAGEVRRLIHAFKFGACGEALPLLSSAMADALPDRGFDCAVPVPLHPRRLRRRGYNQAALLCADLSERTGIPAEECLERTKYGKPQSLTVMKGRRKNVENAFRALPAARGKRILLIDDVRTTGSTAHACADALMKAGAEKVSLCVCAVVYRKK